MMKRFDHENIVKLLGVCTRGEPAYTIMEFMLHGMRLMLLSHCAHLRCQLTTMDNILAILGIFLHNHRSHLDGL